VAKGKDKNPVKKGIFGAAVLEPLLPCMFTVIADNNHYGLVIDGLAVRPLGIF
jgi:hypothetical protein